MCLDDGADGAAQTADPSLGNELHFDCSVVLILAFVNIVSRNTQNTMGKVHGSLARAGKVKGQTPKVEAQEDKKKLPRGRAKKRLQYNRRYVNVVTGMGGKRVGPNSNADKMK